MSCVDHSAASGEMCIYLLFSYTAGQCRALFDKSPTEVDMDELYMTCMSYVRKVKTVHGELSTCSEYIASYRTYEHVSSNEKGIVIFEIS